jgi:hypothetical protein
MFASKHSCQEAQEKREKKTIIHALSFQAIKFLHNFAIIYYEPDEYRQITILFQSRSQV